MKISEGKIEYAEEICNLVRRSITELCTSDHNNNEDQLSDWLRNKTTENIRLWVKNNRTFCAFDLHREMVGVSLLSPANEILLNYVSPAQYKTGVGKCLLEEMEANVEKSSILKVRSTQTALGFYIHMGFVANVSNPGVLEKRLDQ